MDEYKNLSGTSGVVCYETGSDRIRVMFADGSVYLYTDRSAGPSRIQTMKRLAAGGLGLNTYINKEARRAYERKER